MIDLKTDGDLAVLTMAHGKANALDIAFCDALAARFKGLEADESVCAVILTGRGSIFSAGVDLIRALEGGPRYFEAFLPALRRLYETVFWCPKPVVAAINGHAVAGGCVLAAAADRRLMPRDGGRIGVTELLVGLPFPPLAFEIMRYVSAPHRFPEIIFGAATYSPPDALELGLTDEMVEGGALMDQAASAARTLAALSPQAFALSKRQVRQGVADRLQAHGARVDEAVLEIWTAPETFARIRDYAERTFKKS
jgi:enoyl-CoA hydratase